MLVHRISGRLKHQIQKMDTNEQTNKPRTLSMTRSKNYKSHPKAEIMTGMLLLPPLNTSGYHHGHHESTVF